ncbi:MAG: DUF3021 domain-containing protein [Eubacterium sp.]|nr:DUF3021 domain-containing protein [Eubacterium sp.]
MRHIYMKKIKEILMTFCMVTTGVTFATLVYVKVFYDMEGVTANILWQILLVSFLCSLGNLIHPMHEVGRRRFWIDLFVHYLYINVVVLGAGRRFEWFDIRVASMAVGMMLLILIIFVLVSAVIWATEIKESRRMNEKLLEYQNRKTDLKAKGTAERLDTGMTEGGRTAQTHVEKI